MAWRLLPDLFQQTITVNGQPAVGYVLRAYLYNTTTPAAIATNSAGTGQATSFTLNSRGAPQSSLGTEVSLFVDTTQTAGYKFTVEDSNGAVVRTYEGPVFAATNSADIGDIANSTQITHDLDGTETTVAERLNTLSDANILVTDPRLGIATDGTTATTAMQSAIDNNPQLEIPQGVTVVTGPLTMPNNRTLVVNGTLRLAAAQAAGSTLISNSDQVGGNSNIRIVGSGTLDGNKAAQSGTGDVVWHTLVHMVDVDDFEFAVAKVTGNYFPLATAAANTTAAVYVYNCTNSKVHDSVATDYGREAFWCRTCDDSEMYNLSAIGGVDSWSGVQFSGDYNKAYNLKSVDAGASGVSFDCRYSTLEGVVVRDNNFQHAVNFGHSGIPATGSTAKNIISINGADYGIQVAAGTTDFTLDGFYVTGAANGGIRASDSSTGVRIANGKSTLNGGYGLTLYAASATNAPLFEVDNVDLRGNTLGAYTRATGAVAERFTSVRMSDDPLYFSQAINGLGAGGTVVVNNGNLTSTSRVTMQASNTAGFDADAYISSLNDGNFVITTINSGGGGANVRCYIQ